MPSRTRSALEKSPKIQAKPYARIEGQCRIGSRPVPNRELELHGTIGDADGRVQDLPRSEDDDRSGGPVHVQECRSSLWSARCRPQRPGYGAFGRSASRSASSLARRPRSLLGGKGRPVIGRVEPPSGWTKPIDFNDRSEAHIESNRPSTPYPLSLFRGKTMRRRARLGRVEQALAPKPRRPRLHEPPGVRRRGPAPDGSFRIDDVPPGEYRLAIRVNGEHTYHVTLQRRRDSGPFARIVRELHCPARPRRDGATSRSTSASCGSSRGSRSRSASPRRRLRSRQSTARSSRVPRDFEGKFLLIDFGTLWDIAAPYPDRSC